MQNNTLSRPGFSLSGTALKRIACLSMLLDHIGASLLENGLFKQGSFWPGDVQLDGVLRLAGRLAFPIYCFLLVEGFLHTHDFKKYALRMLGFALISEWPFDWAFFSGVYWGHQNVYFTLLLGLLAMKALDTYQTAEGMPALKGILGAAACFLAAALLILIAVAGYLNFADVDLGFKDKETSTDSSSILDDVDYDLTDETALLDENLSLIHI